MTIPRAHKTSMVSYHTNGSGSQKSLLKSACSAPFRTIEKQNAIFRQVVASQSAAFRSYVSQTCVIWHQQAKCSPKLRAQHNFVFLEHRNPRDRSQQMTDRDLFSRESRVLRFSKTGIFVAFSNGHFRWRWRGGGPGKSQKPRFLRDIALIVSDPLKLMSTALHRRGQKNVHTRATGSKF